MQGEFRKLKDGYGFIAGEDGIDYFFHWSGLSKFTKQFRYCKDGEKVSFDVQVSERGPRAVNIKVEGYTIKVPAGVVSEKLGEATP
jgi:CspA family cold shock protein